MTDVNMTDETIGQAATMPFRFAVLTLAAAVFWLVSHSTGANADSTHNFDARFAPNTEGKQNFDAASLYRSSCAPCHGASGDGSGEMAASLKTPVPALNNLADRYSSGYFPERFLIEVIDGRKSLSAHGAREMPIWGRHFGFVKSARTRGDRETPSNAAARQKIEALVEYIRSIQIR